MCIRTLSCTRQKKNDKEATEDKEAQQGAARTGEEAKEGKLAVDELVSLLVPVLRHESVRGRESVVAPNPEAKKEAPKPEEQKEKEKVKINAAEEAPKTEAKKEARKPEKAEERKSTATTPAKTSSAPAARWEPTWQDNLSSWKEQRSKAEAKKEFLEKYEAGLHRMPQTGRLRITLMRADNVGG
jgi:hypothetical protein